MSLATLAEYRQQYPATAGVNDDPLIQALLDAASQAIETATNRSFARAERTEVLAGNGKAMLMPGEWPVTAVAGVSINGQPLGPGAWPSTPGYVFDENSIRLIGRVFERGMANVSITYTAGYDPIPADLRQACIETVALKLSQREHAGVSSKTLAGEVISFVMTDFPRSVERTLNNYRRVVPQ